MPSRKFDHATHEYRLCPSDLTVVQVRPKRANRDRYSAWSTYMQCHSESYAEYILDMLQHPEAAATVRP